MRSRWDDSLRTVIVDDNAGFVRVARSVLTSTGRIRVVGSVSSGEDAVAQAPGLNPDLVLLDLILPQMSGLEAIPILRHAVPASRIVVLTLHDETEYRKAAARAGADGFLSKSSWTLDLEPLLREIFP